jgi:hypothetical protein
MGEEVKGRLGDEGTRNEKIQSSSVSHILPEAHECSFSFMIKWSIIG